MCKYISLPFHSRTMLCTSSLVLLASCGGGSSTDTASNEPNVPQNQFAARTQAVASTNLALNKPATASSAETANMSASAAVDGNLTTRWGSLYSDAQWIKVDLGAATTVNRVVLNWETAYGKSYQIQTSTDGINWSTAYSTTAGIGGKEDIKFNAVSARYVKLNGIKRATTWGYSLYELMVYNDGVLSTPTPTTVVSYQQLSGDMTLPHEALAHGVNPAWSWGSAPRIGVGVNFPSSYDNPNFVPWGVAATATAGSPATNVRVQLRKMILDVKRNGIWSRIVYNTNDSQLMGALYTNYETNATAPANIRKHASDGLSVKLPDSGGSFHFMTTNRFPVWFGAQEIVSRVEARLIVDDTTKTDDRASAKLLVTSGGDVWRNATAQWNPNTQSNVDFAIGRFKFAKNNWATFSSHTLTSDAELKDYLANEPALNPR